MRLKSKNLTGVVQPLSFVDKMLRQQGFSPSGGDTPTYDVVIYDSATSSSYFLRIPANPVSKPSHTGEMTVKLGHPYLEAKLIFHTEQEEYSVIPKEIRQAAEHKLAEIGDYLSRPSCFPHSH
ncbi:MULTISPECIES: hypothetical protein [Brevibacillus]|uniref:hypothetical protein n=1 Tax=Brevibacillus TaxID=55080 RepID=UPI0003A4A304|nr:hypothetical protein [Brevibacillus borstelensis]KKX52642.1 hypothetical protein X546_23525 [Brevibacillus borstelensis cifa_chp40]MBE5394331.1 hypothetical protein [Brevibacillus borstelensis]MCC0565273.1 hypothetical protein [Brevibacillus borstelensis]MCM3471926.1 hypothetical protein [Brevibacillus borstelensis]MCM3559776.1 hypothetical protein [Brevibacillus borstelensis]